MYRNRRIATSSSTFRDIHWLNFSWCEALNPSLNKFVLVHHPNKVWMRDIHCSLESWRKVKIWKERAGDISLEQLYLEPLVPSAQKVYDLKQMACTHVPYHSETSTWTSQISTIALTQTIKTAKRTVTDSPARMAFLSLVGMLYLLLILSDILAVHFNDLSSVFANKINLNFLKSEL